MSNVWFSRQGAAKQLARIGSLRTETLVLEGQGDKAAASLVSSLRLLRVFARQPMLINHLVKIACLQLQCSDIPLIIERGRPSTEALEELEKSLRGVEEAIDVKRILLGERAYSIAMMAMGQVLPWNDRAKYEEFPRPAEPWLAVGLASPPVRSMSVSLLRTEARLIADVEKGFPEILNGFDPGPPNPWNMFAEILAPSLKPAMEVTAVELARLRAIRVAIQIELFRKVHHRLPESLDKLAAKMKVTLPEDPFTGQSLVYRKSGEGYLVYSAGEDKQDTLGKKLNSGEGSNWGIQIRK